MKEHSYAYLLGIVFIFGNVLSAPSDNSFIVTSTEASRENREDGSTNNLPLHPIIYEMDIKSNISNRFAKTLVKSKVKNSQTSAKETTFTVVLPEKAFISEFVMKIGGKSYKAYVKEKEEARRDYNRALESGQSTGHVAVSARDSNRFTVSINVEPDAKATFLLTYEELLERKYDQYELVLNIHPGQIVKNLNVQVHINESRPLKFVKTPSLRSGNEISKNEENLDPSSDIQTINSTSAVVKFSPNSDKQKQFAQYLGGKESDGLSGQFVVQYDVERDPYGGEVLLQDGYFIHFFAPSDLEPLPKHVVFVLDTSGSMGGTKLSQLKDAMKSILSELRTEDIVNIIEFNTWALVWDINNQNTSGLLGLHGNYEEPFQTLSELKLPAPTPVNFETISKAKHIIDKIFATGMTNIIEGLETALYLVKVGQENNAKQTDKKYQPIVIFLTDGEPNVGMASTEQIISTVTKLNSQNNNVPIFSLSFGYGADKEFLKKLSLKNQGFTRHIYEASDASLQLQEFYKQISSPLLSNVDFKYEDEVQHVTRRHFPIYFRGSELVVAGKYKDPSLPIKVTCWGPRGPLDLRPIVAKPVASLERLWAYLTVKQTLDKRDSAENKTELTKKALDLALKYSFVTDVTSLVVVKPNDTSAVDTEEATKGQTYQGYTNLPTTSRGGTYSQSYAGLTSSYQTSVYPSILQFFPYASPSSSEDFLKRNSFSSYVLPGRVNVGSPEGQTYHGRADMPLPTRAYAYPQSYAGLTSSYRTSSLRSRAFYQPSAGYNVGLNRFPGYRSSLYMPSYNVAGHSLSSSTTHLIPQFTTIKPSLKQLPWLSSVLNRNGTLAVGQGTYELGDNSLAITNNDMCLNTPLNATGVCILLKDCTEVYSYLTDFQVYQQYFCALENRYAGVCCPKKQTIN